MSQSIYELEKNLAVLLPYINSIKCNKCGACCGNCEALSGNLCTIHPELIGKDRTLLERGAVCELDAVGLALVRGPKGHIACPLVGQLLDSLGFAATIEYDPDTMIPVFVSVIAK